MAAYSCDPGRGQPLHNSCFLL